MVATVSRGRGRRTINEINMVPFIDVMLVLLIIFMVTAPLIAPSVIDLPSIGKANMQPDRVIQVSISKSGKIELKADANAEPVKGIAVDNIANLVTKAQKGDAKSAVVISADKAVKYENVVEVMDKLQRAGIQRVGLSVQLAK
ncbi:MAG: biopolymer transporter ExbD [Burkholderiaceae bacterium]|jgi:biopolymer transport protein TolR|nr:biopolymer transporter ExbD [Polaromonas sp.]MBP9831600.1 biopolymer transporter ExbD [Polaromonas sp.]